MKVFKNESIKYIECYDKVDNLLKQLESLNEYYEIVNSGVSVQHNEFKLYWIYYKILKK